MKIIQLLITLVHVKNDTMSTIFDKDIYSIIESFLYVCNGCTRYMEPDILQGYNMKRKEYSLPFGYCDQCIESERDRVCDYTRTCKRNVIRKLR
jgi:hypothetical protein